MPNQPNTTEPILPDMPRRFGVELEMRGLSTHEATGALAHGGVRVRHEGHTHNPSSTDDDGVWRVVYDGSLSSGCEAVSPPTRSTRSIWNACRVLRNAGGRVDRQCGTHVHVDATEFGLAEFRAIAKLWLRFEPVFDTLVPPSRLRNNYCRSNMRYIGATRHEGGLGSAFASIEAGATTSGVRNLMQGDRFHKLNLTAWWEHRTIEFRMHSGTLNGSKLALWIVTCVGLVEAARRIAVQGETIPAEIGTLDELIELVGLNMNGILGSVRVSHEVPPQAQVTTRAEQREVETIERTPWAPAEGSAAARVLHFNDLIWRAHGEPTEIDTSMRDSMQALAVYEVGISHNTERVYFLRWRDHRIGRTVRHTETVLVPVDLQPAVEAQSYTVATSLTDLFSEWYAPGLRARAESLAPASA